MALFKQSLKTRPGQFLTAMVTFVWCFLKIKLVEWKVLSEESQELRVVKTYCVMEDDDLLVVERQSSDVLPTRAIVFYKCGGKTFAVMLNSSTAGSNVKEVVKHIHDYQHTLSRDVKYLSVEAEGIDITDFYRMYAGPSNDFYRSSLNASFIPKNMISLSGEIIDSPEFLTVISAYTYAEERVTFESVFEKV